METKPRILYLQKILLERTDEENPLSTTQLINNTMTSPGQVAKLKHNNYVVNRIKPDNKQIYYIIDAINDAINAGKQILFQYYDYTGLKKKVLKNKGEVYKLSPYKLLWCGDYYYVFRRESSCGFTVR